MSEADNTIYIPWPGGVKRLHSRCHPTAPVWVSLSRKTMIVQCAECGKTLKWWDIVDEEKLSNRPEAMKEDT